MLRQQHSIKKRPGEAARKRKWWTPLTKWLIGIPKNLIRIFMLVILVSSIYIIFVITNNEYNLEFLRENGDHDFESVQHVHRLFKFLQSNFDPSRRFKN